MTTGDTSPWDASEFIATLINRLGQIVDQRAAELGVSPEILATRGELKAMVMNGSETAAQRGWRREEIGERLLAALSR